MALEIGQVIDEKYRVIRAIGEGGMGAVYEGENTRIRRRVAIKTLHANIARNQQIVTRFEREAQAAGRIGSDHILEVLDLGALPSGERFIVMEFLDGEPLSKRIAKFGRLTASQLVPIMRQVLEGLGAAHAAGIVHRDLKPDNIYILRQKAGIADFVKLIDFGISKFHSDQQGSIAMTQAGALMGTPLYMSPEQANGSAEADARSDIYSLGMIMFEALSGAPAFTGQNLNELLFKIVLSEVPRLDTVIPGIQPQVVDIVAKATAKKREDRFVSAQEMLAAIDALRMTMTPAPVASGAGGSWRPPPPGMSTPAPVLTPAPMGRTPSPVLTPQQLLANTPQPIVSHAHAPRPPFQSTPHGANTPPPGLRQTPGPALQQSTDGAWGQPSHIPPPGAGRSKAPLFVGLGLGTLLLLGGGLAISRFVSRPKPVEAATVASVSPPAEGPSAAATTSAPTAATAPGTGDPAVTTASAGSAAPSAVPPASSASAAPVSPVAATRPAGTTTVKSTAPPPATHPTAAKKPDWGY